MLVNIDCQFDRIHSHLEDKLLGMSVREFLDWVEVGRPKLTVDGIFPWRVLDSVLLLPTGFSVMPALPSYCCVFPAVTDYSLTCAQK